MLSKRSTLGLDLIPGNQGQQGGQGEYGQGNQAKNRYVGVGVREPESYPGQGQWDTKPPIRQQVPDKPLEYEVLPKLSKRAQIDYSKYLFGVPEPEIGSEYYDLRIPEGVEPPKEDSQITLNGTTVIVQSVRTPDDIARGRGGPVARSMRANGTAYAVNCLPLGHKWLQ